MKQVFIMFLGVFLSSIGSANPYFSYNRDNMTSYFIDRTGYNTPSAVTFEIDSAGVCHVIYGVKLPIGGDMYYSSNATGEFSSPVLLQHFEIGVMNMRSVIDSQDVIHLIWQTWSSSGEYWGPSNLWTGQVKDGVLSEAMILHEELDAWTPDIAVDNQLETHISFEVIEHISGEGETRICYTHTSGGIFQPVEWSSYKPSQLYQCWDTKICVDNGIAYFYGRNNYLLSYSDNHFNPPVRIINATNESSAHNQFIIDQFHRMHFFYRNGSDMSLYHIWSDDGIHFSEGEVLSKQNYRDWGFVPKPYVDEFGNIYVLTYYIYDGDCMEGCYQINSGYGFGEPIDLLYAFACYHSYVVFPQCRVRNHEIIVCEPSTLANCLYLQKYVPVTYENLTVTINSPFTWWYDQALTQYDDIQVTVDIYNPTTEPIQGELAIATNINLAPDVYMFLNDSTPYPSFQEDYFAFPITIPSGWSCQNVLIFECPIDLIDTGSQDFIWTWYACILDSETKELLSNFSSCYSGIDIP